MQAAGQPSVVDIRRKLGKGLPCMTHTVKLWRARSEARDMQVAGLESGLE